MLEKMKAGIVFNAVLKRKDIKKAYKMVGPEDSWYDTISTVHKSLAEIKTLPHEDWQITSHDGLTLKGIFYPGTCDKTMIWVHGYSSHAERESAFPGLFYHSLGYNVLVPYLRSHGPSQGKYISFGALESKDMEKWVALVNQRYPNGGILLHGLSMGGGVVLELATKELTNVKCLIADAPTVSIPGAFSGIVGGTFKSDQDKILNCLKDRFWREFSVDMDNYHWQEKIVHGKYPLLLSAGSNENLDDTLALLQERNPMPTTVVILPGCNHGNGMYKQTNLYQSAIKEFLQDYMDA